MASDGKWYAPEQHPDYVAPDQEVPAAPPTPAPPPSAPAPTAPGEAASALVADNHVTSKTEKDKPLQPWYRRPVVIATSALVVIVVVIIAVASAGSRSNKAPLAAPRTTGSASGTVPPTSAPVTTTTLAKPGLNEVALDGDFAFVVHGVECGFVTLGKAPLTKQAPPGTQWCLVSMTVMNNKTESQHFFAANQKATDASGRHLAADDAALFYLPNSASDFDSTVTPGDSITVVVPFALATGDTIASLELHDSANSAGVTVTNAAYH